MAKKSKDEIKQLLKKLEALAERGVGGEKETARKKIQKLLADNDLTEDDLNDAKENYYLFSYTHPYKEKLMCQCIYKVLGAEKANYYKTAHTRNKVGVYCTPAQKLEIELDFEFYSNLFDEELESFMSAFIDKQDIFPEDVPSKVLNRDELSQEELEMMLKKEAYARNMSKRVRASAYLEDFTNGVNSVKDNRNK